MSVAPTGHAIDVTAHKLGSVSDLVIFQGNQDFYKGALVREEDNDCDTGVLSTNYPDSWAVLLDKVYQDAQQYLRAIIPKKKPHERLLTVDDEIFNATNTSDCIIVEIFWTSHKIMGCYFNKVQVDRRKIQ